MNIFSLLAEKALKKAKKRAKESGKKTVMAVIRRIPPHHQRTGS